MERGRRPLGGRRLVKSVDVPCLVEIGGGVSKLHGRVPRGHNLKLITCKENLTV